ncbi:hypothetical protein [Saccharothrix sp. ST-888]|uniref:hypothetical protein n=1 Tax=Saccharothrix sp. ST-888 TaxID=1427391 RepID=UPI0005ECDD36|nr:hypothetical protein [Saccharothrix sp. ST-888]KJK56503.1 hypothetical protein UK12_22220 [Saccharothrix sp. ST-888]
MTCADYRSAMSAQLDGERTGAALTPVGAGDGHGEGGLAAHAEQCADCRDWLAAARRLRALTAGAQGPSAEWSAGLLDRLLERLDADGDDEARTA